MRILTIWIICLLFNGVVLAQGLPQPNDYQNSPSSRTSFFSGYGLKLGINQTAPGLIVDNTDKDSSGHIQSELDYGFVIGVYSTADKNSLFDFFVHLDYYSFTLDRQLMDNSEAISLDSEANGTVIEIIPGVAIVIRFFEASYLSASLGLGVRSIEMDGNVYLTDGSVSTDCRQAVANSDKTLIKANRENDFFKERILTYSFVNSIDLKLGPVIIRWTRSNSNSSGNAENSPDKQSIDEHDYIIALTNLSLNYVFEF